MRFRGLGLTRHKGAGSVGKSGAERYLAPLLQPPRSSKNPRFRMSLSP